MNGLGNTVNFRVKLNLESRQPGQWLTSNRLKSPSKADLVLGAPHPEERRPGRLQGGVCRDWGANGTIE
jgi:hypothetical protein